RWREEPDEVMDMIRGYLKNMGKIDPVAAHQRRGDERTRLAAECRRRLRNPFKRWLFDFMLNQAQVGCIVRENVKSEAVRFLTLGRKLLLEMGSRLCDRRLLEDREDIFFLRMEEIEPVRRQHSSIDVPQTIRQRRAEYEKNLAINPPAVV